METIGWYLRYITQINLQACSPPLELMPNENEKLTRKLKPAISGKLYTFVV